MNSATVASVLLLALSSPGVAAEPPTDPSAEETKAEAAEEITEEEPTEEPEAEELTGWTTKYEERIASGDRICTVAKPGFSFALWLIHREGSRYQAVKVGHSRFKDAYLRINSNPPLKLEDGTIVRPARGDKLIEAFGRGGTLYIEWTDVRRGTQQESTSLEGFHLAHQECVAKMGAGFR